MGNAQLAVAEKRQHPRIELLASVEMRHGDEVVILSVSNISLGGAYLAADGLDLSHIPIGAERDLTIFEATPGNEVKVRGKILRRDNFGIALSWVGADDMFKVATLIDLGQKV